MSSLPPLSGRDGLGNLGTPVGLGNLAQSARKKHIKSARTILFVIGVLNLLVAAFFLIGGDFFVKTNIEREIKAVRAQGMEPDAAEVVKVEAQMRQGLRFAGGLVLAMAVVYVALGLMVNKYPVPVTILGLVIYVGSIAIGAFFDPSSLLQGGIIALAIRIAIILALVRALKAAIAHQKNMNQITGKPDAVGLGADL